MSPRPRIALVNPNTSTATTDAMVAIAAAEAGARADVVGVTAPHGAPLITGPAALDLAAQAVAGLAGTLAGHDAVVVAAFGDPGLPALRAALTTPVVGLAEAGFAEAAAGGRRFAVVTTTPELRDRIAALASADGRCGFAGCWITAGAPEAVMADPARLEAALADACAKAVAEGGAEAVIIGGGPLARAARALTTRVGAPLIEPLPAAIRRVLVLLEARPTPRR